MVLRCGSGDVKLCGGDAVCVVVMWANVRQRQVCGLW